MQKGSSAKGPAPTKQSPMQHSHDVADGELVTWVMMCWWQCVHTTCEDMRPKAVMPPVVNTTVAPCCGG